MSSADNKQKTQAEVPKNEGRSQNIYLAKIGLMVFITFICCIMFFFGMYRYQGVADGLRKLLKAAQPIIIGLVLAYLLHPVMNFFEKYLYKFLNKRMKKENKAKKVARVLAITGALLFLIIILVLLVAAIVPAVITSVSSLIDTLPGNVQAFINMIQHGKFGKLEVTDTISDFLTDLTDYVETWAKKTLLPQAQTYVVQITSGVITTFKVVLNFIIGIIVAAYVLMIKENLIGQCKKLIFSVFKARQGNIIVEMVHKADEIFGGFISGKIIDSAIIGMICYVGCVLLQIPNALLVAVIVGVTNIIPVFGPFIGAIPSLLLVVIQSPWHALYLLIFIIVLQQVDGNIIGPKILGSSTGLSSFWVMFAILIGGGLFGFTGMLLGVPVFAMIYYIVRRLVNHGINKKKLPLSTAEYVTMARVDESTGRLHYYEEQEERVKIAPSEEDKEVKENK